MAITKTVVKFLNNNATFEFNEDKSVDYVRSSFGSTFGWLSNAAVSETVDGSTKTITFSERTGTKGLI